MSLFPYAVLQGHVVSLFPYAVLQGHVVMGTQAVSPYQQVIEKTKGLAFRSQMLAMTVEKKLGIKTGDNVSRLYVMFVYNITRT